jgi:hypothetical protein
VRVDGGYRWLGVLWRGHNGEIKLALGVLVALVLVVPILGATIFVFALGGLTLDWPTAGVLLGLLPVLVVLGGALIADGFFGLRLNRERTDRPASRQP